jgi:putative heme iron utilization protein
VIVDCDPAAALDARLPLRLTFRVSGVERAGDDPAAFGRHLIRCGGPAALATSLRGAPYASLVLVAADLEANPLLLLSDLAQHSRNLAFDPRLSLLLDGTAGAADPLAGPRLSLLGQAQAISDVRCTARFIARHPASAAYAGFGDFRLYRVVVERGHLVAGFGHIQWLDGADLRFSPPAIGLAAAEAALVRRVNDDRAAAVAGNAARLLGRAGEGWRMTGIDPEGIDLRCGGETARLDFLSAAASPEAALAILAELAENARQ